MTGIVIVDMNVECFIDEHQTPSCPTITLFFCREMFSINISVMFLCILDMPLNYKVYTFKLNVNIVVMDAINTVFVQL